MPKIGLTLVAAYLAITASIWLKFELNRCQDWLCNSLNLMWPILPEALLCDDFSNACDAIPFWLFYAISLLFNAILLYGLGKIIELAVKKNKLLRRIVKKYDWSSARLDFGNWEEERI